MIKSIYMKDCATYPKEGVTIDNCQKINYFYGPNGSGKSTISNYLSNQKDTNYSSCEINWENDSATEIVVYNKDFRERHFKEDIAGVFTLGEATIEDLDALEKLKSKRDEKQKNCNDLKNALNKKLSEVQSCQEKFKEAVWNDILKNNEEIFQEAFSGFRANKEKFCNEVKKRFKQSQSIKETRESLQRLSLTLFSEKPEKCESLNLSVDNTIEDLIEIETNPIWGKTIVGNKDVPISKLIEYLDNADWINRGRAYVHDAVCPFCQQKTITDEFKRQLELFFNGEYEKDINLVESLVNRYEYLSKELLSVFSSILTKDTVVSVGEIDVANYSSLLDSLKVQFEKNLVEMTSKEQEAGKKISITETNLKIDEILKKLNIANTFIINHNKMVDNFSKERIVLVDNVWSLLMQEHKRLISDYLKEIENGEKAINGIKESISQCEQLLSEIDNEIVSAGKSITSVQPTIDEINRSLSAYGFTNFKIVPSPTNENYYQIQRMDGTLASKTLSEGEETFISFLYFLQFAKGSIDSTKVSSKKVIVLDDPICSLDSTVLYIVSSMVKSLISEVRDGKSDVEQVFILTHNVFFHKEVSFINGRIKELKDVHFWIISKDNNISSIRAYERENPINTSYELLWRELKMNTDASKIVTQNIMRRILENYFSILGKSIDETIVNSFPTLEEQIICRSLISWINDGSHSIPDDLYIDSYTDSVERYKDVFKEIFVKMGHETHYDMMMA